MAKQIWNIQNIKEGFEKFSSENGRLPTALEIDNLDYLPTSRHIQRDFGGLKELRSVLGYSDQNFGSGKHRSKIAHRVNKRGRQTEIELETKLRGVFGEVFVHTERIFNAYKVRVDFYVYTPDGNFGADVFYPDNMKTLQSNLNIKTKKYCDFPGSFYYVVANEEIDQNSLDLYAKSKKNPLARTQELVTLDTFMQIVSTMRAYPNPLA